MYSYKSKVEAWQATNCFESLVVGCKIRNLGVLSMYYSTISARDSSFVLERCVLGLP